VPASTCFRSLWTCPHVPLKGFFRPCHGPALTVTFQNFNLLTRLVAIERYYAAIVNGKCVNPLSMRRAIGLLLGFPDPRIVCITNSTANCHRGISLTNLKPVLRRIIWDVNSTLAQGSRIYPQANAPPLIIEPRFSELETVLALGSDVTAIKTSGRWRWCSRLAVDVYSRLCVPSGCRIIKREFCYVTVF